MMVRFDTEMRLPRVYPILDTESLARIGITLESRRRGVSRRRRRHFADSPQSALEPKPVRIGEPGLATLPRSRGAAYCE